MSHPNPRNPQATDDDTELVKVWGYVTSEGAIESGQGFTCKQGDKTGTYIIFFSSSFTNIPAVVVTPRTGEDNVRIATTDEIEVGVCTVRIKNKSGDRKNCSFCLIAVGS